MTEVYVFLNEVRFLMPLWPCCRWLQGSLSLTFESVVGFMLGIIVLSLHRL